MKNEISMVRALVLNGFTVEFLPSTKNRFRVSASHPDRGVFAATEIDPETALNEVWREVSDCPVCGQSLRILTECSDENCCWSAA